MAGGVQFTRFGRNVGRPLGGCIVVVEAALNNTQT